MDVSLVPALSTDEDEVINVHMDSSNKDVIQTVDLDVPNTLFVTASGDGCGLLQVSNGCGPQRTLGKSCLLLYVKLF